MLILEVKVLKKLKIRYLKATNFRCFGPEGIELNFDEYNNIVVIKGKNLDTASEKSSNGVGKSSIADIIIYGLWRNFKKA